MNLEKKEKKIKKISNVNNYIIILKIWDIKVN